MEEPKKAGFLDYCKAAFMSQYNLIATGGSFVFAAMSGGWEFVLPMWIGAEMLWVLGLATNERFQNLVDIELQAQAQLSQEEMVEELPKGYSMRYYNLKERYEEIRSQANSTAKNTSMSVWTKEIDKLSFVLASFIRLSHYHVNLRRLMATFDGEKVEKEINKIQKKLEAASSNQLKTQYTKYLSVLNSRVDKAEKAREISEAIRIQLNIIEEQFKLIQQQIFLVKNPQELTHQLDFLVQGITDIEHQGSVLLDLQMELNPATNLASTSNQTSKKKQQQARRKQSQ